MKIFFKILILSIVTSLFACAKKDKTAPVISLNGERTVFLILNSDYIEPGATAVDDLDGYLQVSVSGEVNVNLAGVYYVQYSATDASGNSNSATRSVVVNNEAALYNADYFTSAYYNNDTTEYNTQVIASTTINNQIWFAGFSVEENAAVFSNIIGDSLDIPGQQVMAGSPLQTHKFSGKGVIISNNDSTIFKISFRDSVSGIIKTGVSIYRKIN